MFDIGIGEILVILVVALLVFGPERLPTMVKQGASWVRDLRAMVANARRDLSDSVDDLGIDDEDLRTLSDLRNPQSFVRKKVLDGVDLGIDDLGLDDDTTKNGSTRNGSNRNGSAKKGAAAKGSGSNSSAAKGSTTRSGTPGSSRNGSAGNSASDPATSDETLGEADEPATTGSAAANGRAVNGTRGSAPDHSAPDVPEEVTAERSAPAPAFDPDAT